MDSDGIIVKSAWLRRGDIEEHRCLFLRHIGIAYEMSSGDRATTKRMPSILWTFRAKEYLIPLGGPHE